MDIPQSVTILGKSTTGRKCPFDTEEVWGVNNVPTQPEFRGCIQSIVLKDGGQGFQGSFLLEFKGDGKEAKAEALVQNGIITTINLLDPGYGYSKTPEIVLPSSIKPPVIEITTTPKRTFTKLFAFDILEKEYTDGMKKYAPVCSWQDYGDIKYPLEEVRKEFASSKDYFTNTISYMLALVAYLRIPLVKIYGVDVTFGAPYAQENRGVEYWIGRAQERGIIIEVPPDSHLLRTVSGVMYGIRDNCNMGLYLHERINLINILPKQGTYSDAIKAHNAWWVLFPKDDEAKAHQVVVNRDPAGNMSFQCPIEFLSDVHMPPEVWEYLKTRMIDIERKGELPFGCISAYEKIVLSQERTK